MPIGNLFIDDLTTATQADLAQAVVTLARSGVEEKFRLDFKETWAPEKQCPDVVAMANSYGGLLILGVSDDRQRFPGIVRPANSDLKTQVASTIAARIAPIPIFEVHTCPAPDDRTKALAVIRVTAQPRVHMYLRGDRPVYVRNEDGTVPASAPQLQHLLERVRNAELQIPPAPDPLAEIASDFYITKAKDVNDRPAKRQVLENRQRSGNALTIGIVPDRLANLAIDGTLEQRFKEAILRVYPCLAQRRSVDLGQTLLEYDDRRRTWFSYRYRDLDRDHEIIWAFNVQGTVQCAFEVAGRLGNGNANLWSISDLFVNLNGSLLLVNEFWRYAGIFSGGQLAATLQVSGLVPFVNAGNYPPLFYDVLMEIPQQAIRHLYGPYSISSAAAGLFCRYDDLHARRHESVIALGSGLLRDLRFGAETDLLRAVIARLP